jgi:hypothetical protein
LYHLSFSFDLFIKKSTGDTKAKGKGPDDRKVKGKEQMIQRPKEKDR